MDERLTVNATIKLPPNVVVKPDFITAETSRIAKLAGTPTYNVADVVADAAAKIVASSIESPCYFKALEGITVPRFAVLDQIAATAADWARLSDAIPKYSFNITAEQLGVLDQQRKLAAQIAGTITANMPAIGQNVLDGLKLSADLAIVGSFKVDTSKLFASNYGDHYVVAPTRVSPPPRRASLDDVDDFLEWLRADLPSKRRGAHEALAYSSDGVSQAANSLAELMRHVFDGLVPESEVWLHMQTIGVLDPSTKRGRHPDWKYRLQLMAKLYGLDEVYLVRLFGAPGISRRIEDIKHDAHLHARAQLIRVQADIEELLAYLAAEISRT